jgi:hypothetical protein
MSNLRFDWETVCHKSVMAVLGRNQRCMSDASFAWDALALTLGDNAVVVQVTGDTDEIVVSLDPAPDGEDWHIVPALADAVGKPLGWCWMATNYLGYRDSFVAFGDVVPDALTPQLTFVAAGSSLSCFALTPCDAEAQCLV